MKPSTEIVSKAQEFVDIYRYPPSRPAPIYPTPQVDKPAAKCRKDVCLLPDCSCGGADIPGEPALSIPISIRRRRGEGGGGQRACVERGKDAKDTRKRYSTTMSRDASVPAPRMLSLADRFKAATTAHFLRYSNVTHNTVRK